MTTYNSILIGFIIIAVIIFISLLFITAPYGRYIKKGWGPLLSARLGWLLMEAPASLLVFYYFIISGKTSNIVFIVFLIIWQIHYFHRAFIFPFTLVNPKPMPVSIVIFAIIFNICNTYIQGVGIFVLGENYKAIWLYDIRFITGVVLFFSGYAINKQADAVLFALRKKQKGYSIPKGGLYSYISCPNYFGEIVTWIGWALLTWSIAGLVFVIWTIANLLPRAISHHKWYNKTFVNYPKGRKALIPKIL